jgi:hypothetical protein
MNIVRMISAIILGALAGGAVNMGLVLLGSVIIPVPEGVDVTDAESIAAGMHLFGPQHFVTPFIAHAAGTLSGAVVAHVVSTQHSNQIAYVIGALFFAGGIAAARMIPAPAWFIATDLLLAYFPMAYLGTRIGSRLNPF